MSDGENFRRPEPQGAESAVFRALQASGAERIVNNQLTVEWRVRTINITDPNPDNNISMTFRFTTHPDARSRRHGIPSRGDLCRLIREELAALRETDELTPDTVEILDLGKSGIPPHLRESGCQGGRRPSAVIQRVGQEIFRRGPLDYWKWRGVAKRGNLPLQQGT